MKTILGVVILILCVVLIISCADENKTKSVEGNDKNEIKWVNADAGLNMRENPSTDSDIVTLLPYCSEVIVLEVSDETLTIGDVDGNWTKVKYIDKVGWVFGGYLSDEKVIYNKINEEIFNILTKEDIEDLKTKIGDFIKQPVTKIEQLNITYNSNYRSYIKPSLSYNIIIINFTEKDHIQQNGYEGGEREIDYLKERDEYLNWENGYHNINGGHSYNIGGGAFFIKQIGNVKYEVLNDSYFQPCGCFNKEYILFTNKRKVIIVFTYFFGLSKEDQMFDIKRENEEKKIIYLDEGKVFMQVFEDFVAYMGNYIYNIDVD